MSRVKAKIVRGAIGSERVAYITTAGGVSAEVILSATQTGSNHVLVAEVARDNNNVLIELPQETSSGDWRVWINKNQILPE
jgi:H+/gluconate symporter-like permease